MKRCGSIWQAALLLLVKCSWGTGGRPTSGLGENLLIALSVYLFSWTVGEFCRVADSRLKWKVVEPVEAAMVSLVRVREG